AVGERGGGKSIVPGQRRRGGEALLAADAAAPARLVDKAQDLVAGFAPVAEVAGEQRRSQGEAPCRAGAADADLGVARIANGVAVLLLDQACRVARIGDS